MVKQREQRKDNRKLTSFPLRTATYPPESVPSAPLSFSTSAFQTASCPGSPTAPTRASASSVAPASRSPTTSRSGTMATTRASPAPRFASYARARASTKAAADAGTFGTTAAQAASEFFLGDSTHKPIPVPTHHTHTPLLVNLTHCYRSPQDVTSRLDRLIDEIREKYHRPVLEKTHPDPTATGNVLIVAHGHILRALALRWSRSELDAGPTFLLEAGGVGTLR